MNWTHDAAVFDELLELNPWSKDLWKERQKLIQSNLWNINAENNGGNPETCAWLDAFFPVRSTATLALLQNSAGEYDNWAKNVGRIAQRLFADDEIAKARVGTPMRRSSERTYSINRDAKVEEYSVGLFKADFLLLAQSSLRDLEINEAIDISNKSFPVGLDFSGARFLDFLNARGAKFGPFSDFATARFQSADFSKSRFSNQANFAVSVFHGAADYSEAVFDGPASFTATTFSAEAIFKGCHFKNAALFDGAVFETRPDFSNSVFEDDTSFADAVFHDSATFADASFPGRVFVGRVPDDVRQGILDAHHP